MSNTPDVTDLRTKAEKILSELVDKSPGLANMDSLRLVHELQIHQIELELQNEELRLAQKEIDESRDKYFELFNSAPVAFVTLNPKRIITQVNKAAEKMLFSPDKILIGKGFSQCVHMKDWEIYFSCLKKAADLESRHSCEIRLKGKGGEFVYASVEADAHFDDNGDILEWRLAIIPDITIQKMAEEDFREPVLKESEELFRAFVTATMNVVYRMNPDWSEISYLQGRTFTRDMEDPGSTWLEKYIHPDDQDFVLSVINEAIRTKSVFDLEHRIIRPDGLMGWAHSRVVPLLDTNGEILGWIGAEKDITARLQAEEALIRSEAHYKTLFESIDEGFCIIEMLFDKKGKPTDYRFLETNPAFERQTGLQDAVGRRMRGLEPSHEDHWFEIYGRIALTGKPERFTNEAKHLNKRWYDVYAFRIGLPEERKVAVIFNDISGRMRADKALKQFNERLGQQVAERTKLAEDRAKQLRALVSELTTAEQRERHRLAEILHDHLQQILVAAKIHSEFLYEQVETERKKIAETIKKLLDQSIMVSRSFSAELSPPVLRLGSLSSSLQWLARWMKKNHGLLVDLETDSSLDPANEDMMLLIFQFVRELMLNVIKHAGVNSVSIEMSKKYKDKLCIAVRDNGVGFDPDMVWEKSKEGIGFGLFSIRERLMLLDGELKIESSPGNGSSFTLIVPLETKGNESKESRRTYISGVFHRKEHNFIRVLLVDDLSVVRKGISALLSQYPDIRIIGQASDGEEAVSMARELYPDVILMDISMPKMDGIEAARIISAELPYIRIIGLSMHDSRELIERMIGAGASAYCTKDCDTNLLLSQIRRTI